MPPLGEGRLHGSARGARTWRAPASACFQIEAAGARQRRQPKSAPFWRHAV